MAKMASIHAELTSIPSEYLGEPVETPSNSADQEGTE